MPMPLCCRAGFSDHEPIVISRNNLQGAGRLSRAAFKKKQLLAWLKFPPSIGFLRAVRRARLDFNQRSVRTQLESSTTSRTRKTERGRSKNHFRVGIFFVRMNPTIAQNFRHWVVSHYFKLRLTCVVRPAWLAYGQPGRR